jgi:hypothetical protein
MFCHWTLRINVPTFAPLKDRSWLPKTDWPKPSGLQRNQIQCSKYFPPVRQQHRVSFHIQYLAEAHSSIPEIQPRCAVSFCIFSSLYPLKGHYFKNGVWMNNRTQNEPGKKISYIALAWQKNCLGI